MRVLNLHNSVNGLFSLNGVPNGGIEKVVYDLHFLLRNNNIEVITPRSYEDGAYGFDMGFYPMNPNGIEEWREKWNHYKERLNSFIRKFNPDVIILHGRSGKLLKVFNEWKIPVLFIDHQGCGFINALYHGDFYKNIIPENRKYGGKVFSVSEFSQLVKEEEIKKQKIDDNFKFDGFIQFQYVTKELLSYGCNQHNDKAITIGRCQKDKSLERIDILRRKYDLDYYLVTMKIDGDKSYEECWKEKIISSREILSRTHCNIERDVTMRLLSRSMLYVSTCSKESAGITAFESLCMGVPVLLWAKNQKHASTMFLPEGRGWAWDFYDDTNSFIEYSRNAGKRKIREAVLDINSQEKVFNKVMTVLENYANKTRIVFPKSLKDFF